MKPRAIIVTRGGEPGQALVRALADAGEETLWLPAFVIGPAPDEARVREVLGNLASYELAVFVSPSAVEATALRLALPWPSGTAIGAVGEGTRRAALVRIPAAAEAPLIAPQVVEADGEGGGSEALWLALQPVVDRMRRVLILRAEQGRDWLGEKMLAAGLEVDTLAVYSRQLAALAPEAAARLQQWRAADRSVVLVVASSEAVDAVVAQLDPVADAAWIRSALALASHERIAQRLHAAGFADVRLATLDVAAIRKATFAQ